MSAVYGLTNLHVKGLAEFDVRHFRLVTCQGTGHTRVVTRADSKLPNYIVHPHGGFTEVELRLNDGRVYRATARCSVEDNFSYREGANQAAARVLQQYAIDNLPKNEIMLSKVGRPGGISTETYLVSATEQRADVHTCGIVYMSWNADGGVVKDHAVMKPEGNEPLVAWRADQVIARLEKLTGGFDHGFWCPSDRATRFRLTGKVLE